MFIFSVKASKKKIFIVLAVILLVVTSVIVIQKLINTEPKASSQEIGRASCRERV